MMESINAFFHRLKQPAPSTNPSQNRNASEATTVVEETRDISTEEKDIGASPAESEGSSGRVLIHQRSVSSTSSPSEGQPAISEKRDPFAGGIEGGVTYQSLKWWYVLHLVPEDI